jgi:hypothetical protein
VAVPDFAARAVPVAPGLLARALADRSPVPLDISSRALSPVDRSPAAAAADLAARVAQREREYALPVELARQFMVGGAEAIRRSPLAVLGTAIRSRYGLQPDVLANQYSALAAIDPNLQTEARRLHEDIGVMSVPGGAPRRAIDAVSPAERRLYLSDWKLTAAEQAGRRREALAGTAAEREFQVRQDAAGDLCRPAERPLRRAGRPGAQIRKLFGAAIGGKLAGPGGLAAGRAAASSFCGRARDRVLELVDRSVKSQTIQ